MESLDRPTPLAPFPKGKREQEEITRPEYSIADADLPIPFREGGGGDRFTEAIKTLALSHGFHLARVTTAEPFVGVEETLNARIAAGHLGGLDWFTPERAHVASAPQRLVPWARALLVLGVSYYAEP